MHAHAPVHQYLHLIILLYCYPLLLCRNYYDDPHHAKQVEGIEIGKYVAGRASEHQQRKKGAV